jgi:hypothetical protein
MYTSSHCILHRHALIANKTPNSLIYVFENEVHILNFIKAWPLNSRLFKLLCNDMDSEYETLNVHTEVCWPTNDKFEMAVFQRRKKLHFLSLKQKKDYPSISQMFPGCSRWRTSLIFSIRDTSSTSQCRAQHIYKVKTYVLVPTCATK